MLMIDLQASEYFSQIRFTTQSSYKQHSCSVKYGP